MVADTENGNRPKQLYDAKCEDLARHMAPELDDANVEALAAFIQDSIENWLASSDAAPRSTKE
jgi:hypothetical protein